MKTKPLFLALIITLFFGCKNVPVPKEPEVIEEPEETNVLTQDEIDIIDEVIDNIIINDIKMPKENLQVSINNTFFIYKPKYASSYEDELLNSENYVKENLTIDDKIIKSFIKRNKKRRIIDKSAEFAADFFWNGGSPKKDYFKIHFSNIGFNENNTEALIYTYIDLPTEKNIKYVHLRKENENWKYNNSISP